MVVGFGLILSQISKMNHRINQLNTQVNVTYPYPIIPSDPNIFERFESFFEKINLEEIVVFIQIVLGILIVVTLPLLNREVQKWTR